MNNESPEFDFPPPPPPNGRGPSAWMAKMNFKSKVAEIGNTKRDE